jgi:hypothetical protein
LCEIDANIRAAASRLTKLKSNHSLYVRTRFLLVLPRKLWSAPGAGDALLKKVFTNAQLWFVQAALTNLIVKIRLLFY